MHVLGDEPAADALNAGDLSGGAEMTQGSCVVLCLLPFVSAPVSDALNAAELLSGAGMTQFVSCVYKRVSCV